MRLKSPKSGAMCGSYNWHAAGQGKQAGWMSPFTICPLVFISLFWEPVDLSVICLTPSPGGFPCDCRTPQRSDQLPTRFCLYTSFFIHHDSPIRGKSLPDEPMSPFEGHMGNSAITIWSDLLDLGVLEILDCALILQHIHNYCIVELVPLMASL